VNYYEHHLGDYMRDAGHLSMLEEGAYRRLLDVYYAHERPLPLSKTETAKLARATSKPERTAVASVLLEFFHETAEGWRHKRCDAEIERYQAKQAKARKSAEQRWSGKRAQIDGNANASTVDDANASPDAMRSHVRDKMRTHNEGNALQSPVTSNQTPIQLASLAARATAGEACKAMRTAGLADVSPSHPALIAMVEQGATLGEFANAAAKALKAGKGFGYALGIVKGDREDAARVALAPSSKTHGLARFALPAGAPRVLPDDLPDLHLGNESEEAHDVDAHRARG
jgi:uncharacterized protein YdaU (DUF1376 family)